MRANNSIIMSALNAATNQNSIVLDCSQLFRLSVQAVLSANTIGGSLQLEGSNDPINTLPVDAFGNQVPVNWSNIGSPVTVTSGATTMIPSQEIGYRWMRVVWTASAGTGTITLNAFALGQ